MTDSSMIAAIENAMIARLRAVGASGRFGFDWKMLLTYPENFDDWLMAQSEIRCPAAWVVFAGWTGTELTTDEDGEDLVIVDGSFGVMFADENLRQDEQFQRHGGPDAAKEPGSYRMVMAGVLSLTNQTLGLPLATPLMPGPLRLVRPSEAIVKRKLSMFACEFSCRFPLTVSPDVRDVPADMLLAHANWDIPRLGDPVPVDRDPVAPGTQLPDDFHADATDHITLGDPEP